MARDGQIYGPVAEAMDNGMRMQARGSSTMTNLDRASDDGSEVVGRLLVAGSIMLEIAVTEVPEKHLTPRPLDSANRNRTYCQI